jgi:hypothetical protein
MDDLCSESRRISSSQNFLFKYYLSLFCILWKRYADDKVPLPLDARSEALIAWTLRPWVRIPLDAWMFVLVCSSPPLVTLSLTLYSLVTEKSPKINYELPHEKIKLDCGVNSVQCCTRHFFSMLEARG